CRRDVAFGEACVIGQVRASDAEVGPYQWADAIAARGPNLASLGHSDRLDAYVLVAADFWTARLQVRVAKQPTGDFSSPFTLAEGVAPDDFFITGGLLSAGLSTRDELA